MFHIKYDFNWSRFSEEKMFKSVDGRWTADHWYTIHSPCEPSDQVS